MSTTGKVLTATRKTYNVLVEGDVLRCTLRGRVVVDDSGYDAVKVGDNVRVSRLEGEEGLIEAVLPRSSQLSRSIKSREYREHVLMVNIDQMVVMLSARRPAFKSGLLDRYLVIAEKNRLQARICINKMDLAESGEFDAIGDYYAGIGYPVHLTSAEDGTGVEPFAAELNGRVSALVGQSGVGKSTLIQAIAPERELRIGEVSDRTNKGMHTTTHVELFPLDAATFIADTPGVRELGLWAIYKRDLQQYFVEIAARSGQCQFADCRHITEPGCAVQAAAASGDMLAERYANYVAIYDSLKSAHYE